MSEKADLSALTASAGELRRLLANEVKLRQAVIKPLDGAQRALKDPHKNAVALHEAVVSLEQAPEELALPNSYNKLVKQLREVADTNLSELEFTFARDLREAFAAEGVKLTGSPTELIAELFVIKPDLRKKQVHITFSRQPVGKGSVKLGVERVVAAWQKARKEICERTHQVQSEVFAQESVQRSNQSGSTGLSRRRTAAEDRRKAVGRF